MGFKKEVRAFMKNMELTLARENVTLEEQGRLIAFLQQQNKELLDRLMARDYPELRTFGPVDYSQKSEEIEDEEIIGTIVDDYDAGNIGE